jgi:hypothetical protein
MAVQVCQLGGHQGTFFQLNQGYGVGGCFLITSRRFIDCSERVDLSPAAKLERLAGILSALRADVTRREEPGIAVRTYFTDQGVTLLS